jgi:hypothetical protein
MAAPQRFVCQPAYYIPNGMTPSDFGTQKLYVVFEGSEVGIHSDL